MRITLLICILFAAPLGVIEAEGVDDGTSLLARHVLLREEISAYLDLTSDEVQDLDDAAKARVSLDGKKRTAVALRHGDRACVAILDDGDDRFRVTAWQLLEVEGDSDLHGAGGGVVLTSEANVEEDDRKVTQRARFILLDGNELAVALTFDSRTERAFPDEDYEIITTGRVTGTDDQPSLTVTTNYRQNDRPIPEGADAVRWKLVKSADGLTRELDKTGDFGISTHTGIARRLEREGLENAALYHARAACDMAEDEELDATDPRRQEAVALATKLEARLRDEVVEK